MFDFKQHNSIIKIQYQNTVFEFEIQFGNLKIKILCEYFIICMKKYWIFKMLKYCFNINYNFTIYKI